jgi:transcriptional regulator with XRE-family HTH domain
VLHVSDVDGQAGSTAWAQCIRDLRSARGLTQGEFAEKVGVSRHTVMRWEAGAPTNDYDTVTRIADTFGLSSADLFALLSDATHVELPPQLHPRVAELARILAPDSPLPDDERAWLLTTLDVVMDRARAYMRPKRR